MFAGFLVLLSLLCITVGCYQYSPALGWIVGGLSLLFWAIAIASAENDKAKKERLNALLRQHSNLGPNRDMRISGTADDKRIH